MQDLCAPETIQKASSLLGQLLSARIERPRALRELARRCGEATGPDTALDAAISAAARPGCAEPELIPDQAPLTAIMEFARALRSPGQSVTLHMPGAAGEGAYARVSALPLASGQPGPDSDWAHGATPALAVLGAILHSMADAADAALPSGQRSTGQDTPASR